MIKKRIFVANDFVDETTQKIIYDSPKKCNIFEISDNGELLQNKKLVEFNFLKINFDEKFSDFLIVLIHWVHKEIVPTIKTSEKYESQHYGVKHEGKIESVIEAVVNRFFYLEKRDLFDFISILLFRITKAHAFHNGNKRTAIIFISHLLSMSGFYIVWSSKNDKYIQEWEKFMIEISSAQNNEEEEKVKKIKKRFINATWINVK